MKRIGILALFFVFLFCIPCLASGTVTQSTIEKQLEGLDFSAVQNAMGDKQSLDFQDLVGKAIRGDLDLSFSVIIDSFLKLLFDEFYVSNYILKNILILAVVSALLKALTDSFKNSGVGELGFYVSYIVVVAVLFSTFQLAVGIVTDLVTLLAGLMKASLPLMVSLIVMSGSVSGAYAFQPVVLLACNIMTALICDTIIPIIILAAGIELVNYMMEKDKLTKFSELMKKICEWVLKGSVILFMTLLSIQRISAPILNNLLIKTTKATVKAIPVVGDALTAAVDTVTGWMLAAKSGVSVALILVIILCCVVPLVKLVVLIIVYRLAAAIIEPVCDPRIVKCIGSIESSSFLLLSAGFTVVIMFVFTVMILLSF